MARLNDTRTLNARGSNGRECSVSIEKIENGFLIRRSECNPGTGEYSCSTEFSRSEPELEAPRVRTRANAVGESSLGDTMRYLGGKG